MLKKKKLIFSISFNVGKFMMDLLNAILKKSDCSTSRWEDANIYLANDIMRCIQSDKHIDMKIKVRVVANIVAAFPPKYLRWSKKTKMIVFSEKVPVIAAYHDAWKAMSSKVNHVLSDFQEKEVFAEPKKEPEKEEKDNISAPEEDVQKLCPKGVCTHIEAVTQEQFLDIILQEEKKEKEEKDEIVIHNIVQLNGTSSQKPNCKTCDEGYASIRHRCAKYNGDLIN